MNEEEFGQNFLRNLGEIFNFFDGALLLVLISKKITIPASAPSYVMSLHCRYE